jgi:hypothetical protein
MPVSSTLRRVFSSPKPTEKQAGGIYTQSPSEQYRRQSQLRHTRPQLVSLPPYQGGVGVYTQSLGEVYMRQDGHRHSQPGELPPYQRAVASNSPQVDFYAPVNEYLPEYYHRENPNEKDSEGQPPQYQK